MEPFFSLHFFGCSHGVFLCMFAGLIFIASLDAIFIIPPNLYESSNVLDGGLLVLMALQILVASINTIQKQWEGMGRA